MTAATDGGLSKNRFKQLKRLKTRRGRLDAGQFLIEGIRAIAAVAAHQPLRELLHAPELAATADGRALLAQLAGVPKTKVRAAWLDALADTVTAQGAIAVAAIPAAAFTPDRWRRVLLLDRVQDPGNVGTLLRAAVAFGFDAVLGIPGSADFYGGKVLRASAGYGLRLPLLTAGEEQLAGLRAAGFAFYYGDAHGGEAFDAARWPERVALWAGNEAKGVDPRWRATAAPVTIRCHQEVESLNVALATAIIMRQIFAGVQGG